MKLFTAAFLLFLASVSLSSQTLSPFSKWDRRLLEKANTARDAAYLTEPEKKVIFYANLARLDGKLFSETFLEHFIDSARIAKSSYTSSLYKDLGKIKNLPVWVPGKAFYEIAKGHAKRMGEKGATGHDNFESRFKDIKKKYKSVAECCQYGYRDPLAIVADLLIDEGIQGVMHRKIMLAKASYEAGVSIQPHTRYSWNCVIDFGELKPADL